MDRSRSETKAGSEARSLLAGDAAKQLGVGVQTLHYYEREELIPAPNRTETGYRLYSPDLIGRIAFVRKAQTLGLSLEEIKEILRLADRGTCPCGHVRSALSSKLADVDRRLQELRSFRRELATLIDRSATLQPRGDDGDICSIVEGAPMSHTDPRAVVRLARPKARR